MDEALLNRVRNLLAKAQSTEFEAEQDAFIAKAQELMAKHNIEEAMFADAKGDRGKATSIRIKVEAPYASAKSSLLGVIAETNNCQAVQTTSGTGYVVTVFGFETELDTVNELFTLLLMHATSEMAKASPPKGRVKSFRHAFLLGFAWRISERLRDAAQVARSSYEADTGHSTALVLRDRKADVLAARDEAFPNLRTKRVSASNGAGYRGGVAAGDRANLGQRGVSGARGAVKAELTKLRSS